ncbi:MAG: hypothetical protein WCS86_00365 [Candidatus Paceibacterota bacterium]
MDTLIIIQIIFYILASIAILAVGILLVIMLYYLIGILKNTRNLSDDINQTYVKIKKHIKKIINSLTNNKKDEKSK